jgi:DNA-binding MarR family transcriptional regulator
VTASRDSLVAEVMAQAEDLMSYRRRAICAQPLNRDVSLIQLHILMTLQDRELMSLSELAHLMHISAPSASSIVDRMVERDLVTRLRDDEDRRVVHVSISEHGRDVVEEMAGLRRDQLQSLLTIMSGEELQRVLGGMQAIQSALARARGDESTMAV